MTVHAIDLAYEWELPDNTFDFVFAGEIIEHVLDTGRFMRNLFRVTKPGGRAVITTPNIVSLENRLRSLFGVHPRWMDFGFADKEMGHCRYFTRKKLYALLNKTGFSPINVRTGDASLSIYGKNHRLPSFVNLFNLGTNLFAIATKPIK